MLNLINYLLDRKIKSILQIGGNPLVELFDILHQEDPSIWTVVLKNDLDTDRKTLRNKFEIIQNSVEKFEPVSKFDLVILLDNTVLHQVFYNNFYIRKFGKMLLYIEPDKLKKLNYAYPPFSKITKFYLVSSIFSNLPLWIQQFMSKFKIFSSSKTRYILGELE